MCRFLVSSAYVRWQTDCPPALLCLYLLVPENLMQKGAPHTARLTVRERSLLRSHGMTSSALPRTNKRLLAAALIAAAAHAGCGTGATDRTPIRDAATTPVKPRSDAGAREPEPNTESSTATGRDHKDAASAGAPSGPADQGGSTADAGQATDAGGARASADASPMSADTTSSCPTSGKLVAGDTRLTLEHQGRSMPALGPLVA